MKTPKQRIRYKFIWIAFFIPILVIPFMIYGDDLFLSFFDEEEKEILNRLPKQ